MRHAIPLLSVPRRNWYCPNCHATATTQRPEVHTEFHICPKLGMMAVPMAEEGLKAKIVAHEREDYIGTEDVQYNADGRPIMSVTVTRDEGEDCAVYAPTAHARVS